MAQYELDVEAKYPLVRVFGLPDHQAGAGLYSDALEPAFKFVSNWFGAPRSAIAIADLADIKAAPFESGTLLLTSMAGEDSKLAEINLVHELVHSAFTSSRPWINEGLAHFAEALYREQNQEGRAAALDFLNLHRTTFVEAEKDIAGSPQKNPGEPLATTFDESYYRSKAAYVWWMLRDMIGDDALKQAIHNYRAADDKDPKYMEQLITATAKRNLAWFFDEPFGDSSAVPTYYLSQATREKVTVALSGDGGDENFAGYRRYAFHAREERIRAVVPAWIRRPVFGLLGRLYPQLDWAPRALRARHTFKELSLDSAAGYFWNLSVTDDETRRRLFSPMLRHALRGYDASEVVRQHWATAPDDDPVAIAQYVDVKTWLPGDILTKVDRTAMANSLEVRVPMLDHNFVNWALGLPSAVNRRGSEGKILLKRAFSRLVPNKVLDRPKQGFSVPLARWFRGIMGQHLEQKLSSKEGLASAGYLNPQTIHRLIADHQSGRMDHSRALWLIWMFEEFMEAENGATLPVRLAERAAGQVS